MEGPTRSLGEHTKEVSEVDYLQRIMSSLTDSSPAPAESTDRDSGVGSSYESYGRIPDMSPGLNPWGFFAPQPELAETSEPSWSPIQREIMADFPWLNEELVVSKEESDACTPVPTDQVAWAQSMLELHAFENFSRPEELQSTTPVELLNQERSASVTPAETPFNSESLSSSLSNGEPELKEPRSAKACSESGSEAAGTSVAQRGKRKRSAGHEDGDAPSDDQETSKKPMYVKLQH